eukprot:13286484-Alexandrium_andersonii.AAC.1
MRSSTCERTPSLICAVACLPHDSSSSSLSPAYTSILIAAPSVVTIASITVDIMPHQYLALARWS